MLNFSENVDYPRGEGSQATIRAMSMPILWNLAWPLYYSLALLITDNDSVLKFCSPQPHDENTGSRF